MASEGAAFAPSFLGRLAAALLEQKLDAVVIGNAAAVLRGAPVMTKDVDLLVRSGAASRSKVWKLARALGAEPPIALADLPGSRGLAGAPTVVRILVPGGVPVDVVYGQIPGGLDFKTVKGHSTVLTIGSARLQTASLEDVIASKEAAGRPKDLASLPSLRATLAVLRARGGE